MTQRQHLLVHGGTFAAVGDGGDISGVRGGSSPDGLFVRDARHLSRWQLTVDGAVPESLTPVADGDTARCVLVPRGGRNEPPAYTLFREQAVGDGSFVESLRVTSNRPVPTTVRLALTADADFTDQFELRSDHRTYTKIGATRSREVLDDGVEFTYRRGEWRSCTTVKTEPAPDGVEETGTGARRLVWTLDLDPHGSAELLLRVMARPHGDRRALRVPRDPAALNRQLLTSLFALPYRPQLAAATLPALAATQAKSTDPDSVAQPGKIVHEVRHGELAHFDQVPYGRYYGSVDATPLFLVLLGAYVEQTRDITLARRLEPHARAAIAWMLDHGGLTSRGYLVYRADQGGLANQNWKDSPGAICSADGTRASGPVMAAGAQGYAYDALRRTAWIARTVWEDETYAALLEQAAADLRDRFQRDFWMRDRAFPALALDGEGSQVDALASDAGHLLWSGLLDKEYGELVGRRLLEPDFFSGWGVRTLASGQSAYHPLSYHRGSVWPHDNALITLGLARYGLHDEARTVAHALVDAATATGHRLPEVWAGYGRSTHGEPVPYPHACVREARSAAAPLALLTAVGGA